MRVDKWIWAVRMAKSRTLATALCKKGKVLINDQKAKAASNIKIDDVISVENSSVWKLYKVTGFIPKRVSAELAAQNYEDLTPKPEVEDSETYQSEEWGRRARGEGRPTKKDWRDIQKAKNYYE